MTSTAGTPPDGGPRRPVLSSGADAVRLLSAADRDLVSSLYVLGANPLVVEPLAVQSGTFLDWLHNQLWSLPMALTRAGEPVGVAFTLGANVQNLNARLVVLATDPGLCSRLLPLYVRHVFWSFPVHRLYAQFPSDPAVAGYAELFRASGFAAEGVLKEHQGMAGRYHDVLLFGLVRPDFERWCADHEPALALAPAG